MREFIEIDNERALEVDRGMGTFQIRKPKVPEGCREVTVRENSDELTWYASCWALYKGIEGEDWEEMCEAYKEMSRAVVVKPQETRKQQPSGNEGG